MDLVLRDKEMMKYKAIKDCVENHGNKRRVMAILDYSMKQVKRMIEGYKTYGKEYFVHGNRGKKPAHTIDEDTRATIIDLYRMKYYDSNLEHYSELLEKYEDITVSASCIRNILLDANILSPKARRKTKKDLAKKLRDSKQDKKTKKEIEQIDKALLSIEDSHPRRPRCAYFGEMLQMDASIHNWFGNTNTHLHIAVDDCTGTLVGAYFDEQETLNGYYNVLHQVISNYGIPAKFLTDRRTVFEYLKKGKTNVEDDTFTQFGYACKTLGIAIQTTSVSQAKGRVERMFQTLQSRLIVELRLANVTTVEEANKFLKGYIAEFNAKFALPINNIKSVFIKQPEDNDINLILAVLTKRTIDSGHCIRYCNQFYKLVDSNGEFVYYARGTTGMVIKAFDNALYISVHDKVYALEAVPAHARTSKTFDPPVEKKERKKYIPPMSHPWKQASFEKFVEKQKHRKNVTA